MDEGFAIEIVRKGMEVMQDEQEGDRMFSAGHGICYGYFTAGNWSIRNKSKQK
jgi:hypothetical protein